MKMKVVFCWSDISGYMAACWRALQQTPDVEVFVVGFQALTETAFSHEAMQGIPCRLLDLQERRNANLIKKIVLDEHANVVVLCGWFHKPYRQLAFATEFSNKALILGFDTPWQGTWKQQIARIVLQPYMRRMKRVVVNGERSWQYAHRILGIQPQNLVRGLYCGIDYTRWARLGEQRFVSSWPRKFLFVGRYVAVKGIDVLVKAYREYRSRVAEPWALVCCGQGALGSCLVGEPGIENLGFVQPDEMQTVWQAAGAFLLPSRFDPWPLALVEAAAAGLPLVCTDACGSAVEVVRPDYNGFVIPPNDSMALADTLVRIHHKYDELPVWGTRSQQLAAPYGADVWAARWRALIMDVTAMKHTRLMEGAT